jgi:hypothetical protein
MRNTFAAISAEIRAQEMSEKACESLRIALETGSVDRDEAEYLAEILAEAGFVS